MSEVYLLHGARTPFGTFGGSLRDVDAEALAVIAAREAILRAGVDAREIDATVFGQVVPSSPQGAYMPRHVGLHAGVPVHAPALAVNRMCGSGLQAILTAADDLRLARADLVLAGGAESMSRYPYSAFGVRFGSSGRGQLLTDMLQHTLRDEFAGCSMGDTAERLAGIYGITRREQDEFAMRSHARAVSHREALREETVPVDVGANRLSVDEHVREGATQDALSRLRPVFASEGSVTAGNSSGINDGAAAVILASGRHVHKAGLKPLARLISQAVVGVEPGLMGLGPVPALTEALSLAGLSLAQMDVVEVNEAFAAQVLAVARQLGVDPLRLNAQGGAIALGHPVGASGTRLFLTAALQLRRTGGRYAAVALCIGGGQGIAAVLERVAGDL